MKTIIAISNVSNKGKSSTLRELAKMLEAINPSGIIFSNPSSFIPTGDFRLIITVNGKTIAIESKGDPSTDLGNRLEEIFNNYNPDIIFCSSRTSRTTVDDIKTFATTHSYQLIWTSTYHMDNNHNLLNNLKAKHMIELLQTLNII
jgi:hypothetical protein